MTLSRVLEDLNITSCYGSSKYWVEDYATVSYYDRNSNRKTNYKVGRILTKLYPDLTPGEITHICERIKALLTEDKGDWKILEGEAIRDAYYTKNYYKHTGMLGGSCMRYKVCQKYLDIYVDNAKMLVLVPKHGKRIMGRAILWEVDGKYVMDRVYGYDNYINYQFYAYAKKNNWFILARNDYVCVGDEQRYLSPDDNYKHPIKLDINIPLSTKYCYYPYIDSVRYLNVNKTILSNKVLDYSCHNTGGFCLRLYRR